MLFSLLTPLRDVPLAVLDVETTGASTEYGDRVTELGIVRIEKGQVVREYQQLFDPGRHIGPGIVALTGITNEMVKGQPRFDECWPAIREMLAGAAVVGHNVRFDLSFMHGELRRCRTTLIEASGDAPVFDTVRIARRLYGKGGNGLQKLSRRLGIEPSVAHRALADAQTTARVLDVMLCSKGGWDMCLCDAIALQGGPMSLQPPAAKEQLLPWELEEAIESRGAVRMEYLDARQKPTIRVIEPIEIRRFRGEVILIAHCQLRNERRTFKVDRIVRLERIEPARPIANDATFEVSATFTETLIVENMIRTIDAPVEPSFVVEPSLPDVDSSESFTGQTSVIEIYIPDQPARSKPSRKAAGQPAPTATSAPTIPPGATVAPRQASPDSTDKPVSPS